MVVQYAEPATDTGPEINKSARGIRGSSVPTTALVYEPGWAATALSTPRSDLIRERFRDLADWWHEATSFMSSPSDIARHPAYQRIIEMGETYDVVPMILEDLRNRGGAWYVALRRLVTDPPHISQETARNSRRVVETWLEWGRQHGYRL